MENKKEKKKGGKEKKNKRQKKKTLLTNDIVVGKRSNTIYNKPFRFDSILCPYFSFE